LKIMLSGAMQNGNCFQLIQMPVTVAARVAWWFADTQCVIVVRNPCRGFWHWNNSLRSRIDQSVDTSIFFISPERTPSYKEGAAKTAKKCNSICQCLQQTSSTTPLNTENIEQLFPMML
jgi:hypothetical protein